MATTLRLDDAEQALLAAAAAQADVSQNDYVRQAIRHFAGCTLYRSEVRAAFAAVDEQYADLYERLRTA